MHIPPAFSGFLDRALPVIQGDARFIGVLAAGSWIHGKLDEYSDLDLVLIVRDSDYAAVMPQRKTFAETLGKLGACFTGEHVGEPRLLICLYLDPLLHVDLKFVMLKDLAHRVEDPAILWDRDGSVASALKAGSAKWPNPSPQWLEDRFWIWMHYGVTKLGRGEMFELLDMLTFMRSMVFGPMIALAEGKNARGVRFLEGSGSPYVKQLEATICSSGRTQCAEALREYVRIYRELRDKLNMQAIHPEAEDAVVRYLDSVVGG